MLDKKIAKLDFNKPAQQLHNLIRGLSPWPVAHTTVGGKLLKVHRAVLSSGKGEPGAVIDNKKFIVACKEGALELLEVQMEGGKRRRARISCAAESRKDWATSSGKNPHVYYCGIHSS